MPFLNRNAWVTLGLPLFLVPWAWATLDFTTYRIRDSSSTLKNAQGQDSVVLLRTYELTRLGSVNLEAASLEVTSQGQYLRIVEEGTLVGNLESKPHDVTQDFLFQGFLPVPEGAAVHRLAVMHGDTTYTARLEKAIYSWNDSFFDSTALRQTLDHRIAFLQKLAPGSYEATFTRLAIGEPVRIRIEYALPLGGAPGAVVKVPMLLHQSGQVPRQMNLRYREAASSGVPLQLIHQSGRVNLADGESHTLAYQSEFRFRRDEAKSTTVTLQASSFASGSWKGHYLMLKAGLNDSLMTLLSRRTEVMLLWRWHESSTFVERRDGLKNLSAEGEMLVLQAKALRKLIEILGPKGHRFGLLHLRPDSQERFFPMAGGDGLKALIDYLAGYDALSVYEAFKNAEDPAPPSTSVTPWKDSSDFVKSQTAFFATLERLQQAFGNDDDYLHHIEWLGLGSVQASPYDWQEPERVETILGKTTIAQVFAGWPGIRVTETLRTRANANLGPIALPTTPNDVLAGLPPLLFPAFAPATVEYRVYHATGSQSVVMPFAMNADREVIFKSQDGFVDSVALLGIDVNGNATRELPLPVKMRRQDNDTGLARLWAADADRISDRSEVELGLRYGILTQGTYWTASTGDGQWVATSNSGSVAARLPRSLTQRMTQAFAVRSGCLHIRYAGLGNGVAALNGVSPSRARAWMEVYDLGGRRIATLDLQAYATADGFSIPLEALAPRGAHALPYAGLTVVLRIGASLHAYRLPSFGTSR